MDGTEPTLVPEWLRNTGNVAGCGASIHHSDVSFSAHPMRCRSLRGNSDRGSPRYQDNRSSSSNSRHGSSTNGSGKHPYSNFSRSHWDRNSDREKGKSLSDDFWDHKSSEPLASILNSGVERSVLRRSQSLVSRKPRRIEDSHISGNGVVSGGSNLNVTQKAVFEEDFPSLGTEKQCGTGIRRVLSPGLSSALENLPVGNSGFLGGERWTSALAEVPATLANNGVGHPPLQQGVVTCSNSSMGISSTTGLNMAEALSQPAARVHASRQLPDKSQRLEELAIKQSRQLIPMTSSMPKPLVLRSPSADKSKQPKIASRSIEVNVASRGVHPQPHAPHFTNQSRTGHIRSDSSATNSHLGKFLVLKPGRESVTTGPKDASTPTGDANAEVANDAQLATMAPSTLTTSISLNDSAVSALENKAAAISLSPRSTVDKRSSQSVAQSRSQFFNLMRRKASPRTRTIHSDSGAAVLSPNAEISGEKSNVINNGNQMNCCGDRYEIPEKIKSFSDVGDKSFSGNGSVYPDEEEAAFLRSLGWEENGGEDEGLTEEEINAFYQEYMSRRPSLVVCGSSQHKCTTPSEGSNSVPCSASSESRSSGSDSEV